MFIVFKSLSVQHSRVVKSVWRLNILAYVAVTVSKEDRIVKITMSFRRDTFEPYLWDLWNACLGGHTPLSVLFSYFSKFKGDAVFVILFDPLHELCVFPRRIWSDRWRHENSHCRVTVWWVSSMVWRIVAGFDFEGRKRWRISSDILVAFV